MYCEMSINQAHFSNLGPHEVSMHNVQKLPRMTCTKTWFEAMRVSGAGE